MAELVKELAGYVFARTTFWACLILAAILLIASFFIPPIGVIDGSALKGAALLLGFASLGFAIGAVAQGLGAKVKHGDTELEITKGDGNSSEEDR